MAAKKIDYDTILACKQGDSDALNRVLVHYECESRVKMVLKNSAT